MIGRWIADAWQRSGKEHTTTYRHIFLVMMIGLVSAGLIWNGFQNQSDARVDSAIRSGLERQYDAELAAYNLSIVNYTACVEAAAVRVDARIAARDTFFAIVDISAIFPEPTPDKVREYIETRNAEIERNLEPLSLEELQAKCVKPGVIPVDPTVG